MPMEIRIQIYKYAFGGLSVKPLQRLRSEAHRDKDGSDLVPSLSFMSLAVSRQWYSEVTPYIWRAATFDFTAHPGDPPYLVSAKAYEMMRHVVILETHCFSTDWLCQVLDKMSQVQMVTIRKLRRVGVRDSSDFDGPTVTQKYIERVKTDPLKTLLGGYRFDHIHVRDVLTSKWPERRVTLEGKLWLDDVEVHSVRELHLRAESRPR
jgi:hypothetical protein